MDSISVELRGDVHRLESELHDSSYAPAEGNRPDAPARRSPVGGDDWRGGEIPALLHVVVDEPLKKELVHGRLVDIGMTSDRPYVVCKKPNRPWLGLHEHDHRGPQAEFSLPEKSRVGCSRQYQTRPDAPDHLALLRHEEKRRVHVPQPIDASGLRGRPGCLRDRKGLVDDWCNPTNDQIPVLRYAERDHRLDVQNILGAVSRAIVEVEVLLDGNADEAGYRVLRRISQRVGVYGCRWRFVGRDLRTLRADGGYLVRTAAQLIAARPLVPR